jgi:DsbE subfamily thiol:disulfide oxidoreductase
VREQNPIIYHAQKISHRLTQTIKNKKNQSVLVSESQWLINLFLCVLCVLCGEILFSGCKETGRHAVAGIGDTAPKFTLTDLDGKRVSLKDYRGKKVILNFWATWCPPCVKEMPLLQEVYSEGKDNIEVIGINYNEDLERIRKFAAGHEIKFTILIDTDLKVSMDYGVIGLPVTFFIDKDGRIKDKFKGEINRKIIEERLKALSLNSPVH